MKQPLAASPPKFLAQQARRATVSDILPFGVVMVWAVLALYLAWQQHATFHTHLLDQGYYVQVLWNTARGSWFANSLKYPSFLGDHFSPILALLAPLFWLAPNGYMLQIVKVAALALALLPTGLWLREKSPRLALWVMVALALNPALHQLALQEFHEIILAAPLIAVAFYAAERQHLRSFLAALVLLLLVREDMGVYVALWGAYLLFFRPAWRKIGAFLLLIGLLWTTSLAVWIMPYFQKSADQQLLGGAYVGSQLLAGLQSLEMIWQMLSSGTSWQAVLALLLPLAGLPLLARGQQVIWGGAILFLLIVPLSAVGALHGWYLAPLLPVLWGSVSVALWRLPHPWRSVGTAALLLTSLVTFYLWSPFPGGKAYATAQFSVTQHQRIGHQIIQSIPEEMTLLVQNGLGAHLAARANIHLFPWYQDQRQSYLIVLDRNNADIYPFTTPQEYQTAVNNYLFNPNIPIELEQDGYLIFQVGTSAPNWRPAAVSFSSGMQLRGLLLAQTDVTGKFLPVTDQLAAGQMLRVELLWTTLQPMTANYAISLIFQRTDGVVLTQRDAWPGQGALPTLLWQVNTPLRDIHYLPVPADLSGPVQLKLVVYDVDTLERLSPADVEIWRGGVAP